MPSAFHAVILAGGKGERFWPLSTSRRPKQLLSLVGDKPLLAQAVDRIDGIVPRENRWIITRQDLREACREAAPGVPAEQVIGEPVGRDTAAAVALAAALVKSRDPNGVFCILTADHVIGGLPAFQQAIRASLLRASAEPVLVTLGIPPAFPSTGYGYVEAGDDLGNTEGVSFWKARRFVEKPDAEKAKRYLAAGNFFWNSGMFAWSVEAITRAFALYRPALAGLMEQLLPVAGTPALHDNLATVYPSLEKISIDYAVMEKADNIVMARGSFTWDDVGSWTALENHVAPDADGNTVVGTLAGMDASGNIVYSRDHLTALLGVKELIVVQAPGVTLVCPRERAQDIKKLVEKLRGQGTPDEVL